ncbi:hypothetical protein [Streptomyces sp. Root1310]|uniref:hypothetical protein n=1 Tax=Streptomyces sp. Root1310 TaxID=1736452 RepID=UPI0012FED17B|nr:hypothetical protein [Streptomyces sp. Root1310]
MPAARAREAAKVPVSSGDSSAGITDPANQRSAASRTRWPMFSIIDPSSSSSVTGNPADTAMPDAPERK